MQVCGDGEYVIYTALAWRNKSFGQALEFVWGDDSNVFATRESTSTSERLPAVSHGSACLRAAGPCCCLPPSLLAAAGASYRQLLLAAC